MLSIPGSLRIFLSREVVDLRKAHDGLCAIVRQRFGQDPMSGDVFVFFNRRADRVKVLIWDRNGFVLWYKRLERGRFTVPSTGTGVKVEMTRAELSMILEGIEGKQRYPFTQPVVLKPRRGRVESQRSTGRTREAALSTC